jgi:hypothetical protein
MRFLFLLLSLLLVFTVHAAQYGKPFGQLQDEQKYKDYTVRIYRNEEPPPDNDKNPDHQDGLGCFEILRSGKQVYFQAGVIFKVGYSADEVEIDTNAPKMGQSIVGDKEPDLVITEINGGNNYQCDYYVFQISDTFKFIAQIKDAADGEFKDLRGNGNLDLGSFDCLTFEGWNCCEAATPQPTVIFRYQDHKYRLDLEKMKQPAPTEQELEGMAAGFKAQFADIQKDWLFDSKWSAPYEMWGKMLNLIYSGNMDLAWRLCDLSWPADHPGKEIFLKEFKKQLATSPYHIDIERLNGAVHKG